MEPPLSARFQNALSVALSKTPELWKIPCSNTVAPEIVNVVTTTHLLPQVKDPKTKKPFYKLPLESFSRALRSCSQFAPRQFAANILRLKDSTSDTTSLVFRSGKIVTVGGLSKRHTCYTSQLFRIILEQVNTLIRDPVTNEIYCGNLVGRTTFNESRIQNVVGSGNLGIRMVDLPKLRDAAPHCCKYEPGLFPGLKFKVWTTDTQRCECAMAINLEDEDDEDEVNQVAGPKTKCACVVKCLIFDTAELVVTGARSVAVVYSVFYRIKRLAVDFEDKEGGLIPKEMRFRHRLARMMIREDPKNEFLAPFPIKQEGNKRPRGSPVLERTMDEDEAVAVVLVQLRTTEGTPRAAKRARKRSAQMDVSVTPMMKMADNGRVNNVRMLLAMDPEQAAKTDSDGNTALDRLLQHNRSDRTPQHEEIIKILTKATN